MDTLTLSTPDLVESLNILAVEEKIEPEKLLDQAVATFLDSIALKIMQSETVAFQAMHEQLVEKHFGQFVAIHNQKTVDQDSDLNELRKRIRQQYGRVPILLRQVTHDASVPVFHYRSRRLSWSVHK